MDQHQALFFLFTIAQEIKRSFESPVILLTMKDYADCIFNSLVDMRTALIRNAAPDQVANIISRFHLEWLQAVQDVEDFKKRVSTTPRDHILKAIDYTVECVKNRRKYFQRYIEKYESTMTLEERTLMRADLNAIEDMRDSTNSILQEKQFCFRSCVDQVEYHNKVADEIEEVMNWLDRLNDNLAIQFSKVLGLKPHLLVDLTKTLQNIIEQIAESSDPVEQQVAKKMQCKRREISTTIRVDITDELEMIKIIEKISELEKRIQRLKIENSSAIMALQHKTLYFEERLRSLENLKISLNTLKNKQVEESYPGANHHMFDHLLPAQQRCRLVERLVNLWNESLYGVQEGKSIISILSVTDIKEIFSDEIGKFTVDKYGRKLYKDENEEIFYQLNDSNELVEIQDDEKHVYFFDDCGRYYINENQERIYKARKSASEYAISHDGRTMLKLREFINGTEYLYDHLGRYCIEGGKRIYSEPDSNEKYEHDGLGNLVLVREDKTFYETMPSEPAVTEVNKYLQRTVGAALRTCLADVVLKKPADPIEYLASSLEKYRHNIKDREKQLKDEIELMSKRKERMFIPLPSAQSETSYEESESYDDYTLVNYKTLTP